MSEQLNEFYHHLLTSKDFMPKAGEPPNKVYHYSSAAALHGVIKDNQIYATEVNFLNDKTEFFHGIDIIRMAVAQEMKSGHPAYYLMGLTQILLHPAIASRTHQGVETYIFTTSYSEVPDDLNQWRAYGQDGSGYCFGVNPYELPRTKLYKMIYSVTDQLVIIRTLMNDIFNAMPIYTPNLVQALNSHTATFPSQLTNYIVGTLLLNALVFKHKAFKAEAEWRAIQLIPKKLDNSMGPLPVLFTDKRGEKFIPRTLLPMPDFKNTNAMIDIYVGPKQLFDKAKIALTFETQRLGIPKANYNIIESNVPYQ